MNKTMLMIDIETGSAEPSGAAIFSIGTVAFTVDDIVDMSYLKLDPRWAPGRRDRSTYEWWMRQDAKIREETMAGSMLPWDATAALSEFAGLVNAKLVWAYPARFDLGHLRELYHAVGHAFPLEYWRERDMTTLLRTFPMIDTDREAIKRIKEENKSAHDALADALTQAKIVQYVLKLWNIDPFYGLDR